MRVGGVMPARDPPDILEGKSGVPSEERSLRSRSSHPGHSPVGEKKEARIMNRAHTMTTKANVLCTDNEDAYVAAAKAGYRSAFEEMVNRYEKKIYRLGLHITGNPEDAEDVLQETFLNAFDHLSEFRGDSRFYTWLVRIAVNESLMRLRKRRSDKSVPIEDGLNGDGDMMPRELADWRPNPEQLLAQTELRAVLQQAMRTLSPALRAVFSLRDVEGFSTQETAELLCLSIPAVKARMHRSRLQLREELSKTFRKDDGRRGSSKSVSSGRRVESREVAHD